MKGIEYSFKILDKKINEIEEEKIIESKYNEIINNKNITLKEEWGTKYEDSTLYGKKYKNEDGYTLFVWKEVFK